jgi:orotidine-5'-phosphate decarboxylase
MDIETARNKLIFALDVPDPLTAYDRAQQLHTQVGVFKVGLELFMAGGPKVVKNLNVLRPIMLDLKLHDIPETVARAVKQACDLGVKLVTLHVQQREALEQAAKVAEKYPETELLGVTMLTSMGKQDLIDLVLPSTTVPVEYDMETRVLCLACFAYNCGIDGLVCSPKEVAAIRKIPVGPHPPPYHRPVLVTPGIVSGKETRDHKRSATPWDAIRDGSDYLVVGRPIRDAPDPVQAAKAIVEEIAHAATST